MIPLDYTEFTYQMVLIQFLKIPFCGIILIRKYLLENMETLVQLLFLTLQLKVVLRPSLIRIAPAKFFGMKEIFFLIQNLLLPRKEVTYIKILGLFRASLLWFLLCDNLFVWGVGLF